jgi:hypothetical protein
MDWVRIYKGMVWRLVLYVYMDGQRNGGFEIKAMSKRRFLFVVVFKIIQCHCPQCHLFGLPPFQKAERQP